MLSLYVQSFQTVEINNTFYRLPEEETVRRWREKAPDGFLFAVKASRYITHLKHLLNAEGAVNQFLERINLLEEKLGPILFQLSPQWHVNAERLRNFVAVLPEERRYAFEFRHHSWYTEEIFQILEEGGCSFCIHDHRDAPSPEEITARFAYVRLHCSPTTEGAPMKLLFPCQPLSVIPFRR